MQIVLTLSLPRDELSVPVARHIVDTAMRVAGVAPGCVDDVVIALSEACTNVLQHSGPGDDYEVRYELARNTCAIKVVDLGGGFDPGVAAAAASGEAERGRGVQLMHALVDRVSFESKVADGHIVHLEKHLEYIDGSLLDRARRRPATT